MSGEGLGARLQDARGRATSLAQWLVLGALVGVASGAASAAFLLSLAWATSTREAHEELVFALPLAGLVVGAAYARWGRPIQAGNNLVLDTLHDARGQLPVRMGPMVFVGTVLTHLFGGSAGREGTAVQMGASLADLLSHTLRVSPRMRAQLLAAGIAGGFGSVFGTPVAGAIFGLEVLVVGNVGYDALAPAVVASVVGDLVTRALGVHHTVYTASPHLAVTPLLLAKWVVFGLAVAAVTTAFVELVHVVKRVGERAVASVRLGERARLPLRMLLGGAAVVALWRLVGTSDYLGLGVPTIERAFTDASLPRYAFALKLVFTAITLGAGFLGGEVTPLFFIGAALGNALAGPLQLPLPLAAAVGMAAVFGAAANTPIALSVMAIELVGADVAPHVVFVSVVAFVASGHKGIYPSQRGTRPTALS